MPTTSVRIGSLQLEARPTAAGYADARWTIAGGMLAGTTFSVSDDGLVLYIYLTSTTNKSACAKLAEAAGVKLVFSQS